MTHRSLLLVVLTASLVLRVAVDGAYAGTYDVTGTCSAWTAFNTNPARIASYSECPRLRARNVIGSFSTPENQQGAGWRFDAPAGTAIRHVSVASYITGGKSWSSHISVLGRAEDVISDCTLRDNCDRTFNGDLAVPDLEGPIVASVRCFDSSCPNSGSQPRATLELAASTVTLFDPSPPSVATAGGALADGGWHGGRQSVAVSASDNTGIRAARALIDGSASHSDTTGLSCDFSHPLPCANHDNVGVSVDLAGIPDGQHSLVAQAEDAAVNEGSSPSAVAINVDNTPPAGPSGAHLAGGPGFRTHNTFAVAWVNPPQQFAPIAGADYRLCPQGQPASSPRCRVGTVDAADINRLGFQLPGPGAWTLRFWLRDAAGNALEENGVTIGGLGLISGRGKRTHLSAGKRRGRRVLRRAATIKLGHSVKLSGRLTAHHKGLGNRTLLVYRRVSVQGAQFHPVAKVRTDGRGRYAYRARSGPSRTVRFVFPGGRRAHGRIADVAIHVRAKLSIRRDRRTVRNGDSVTLSGRLRGGHVPPGGALLELQVYTRGRWRPFATPRTDTTGRWSYPYRFETISGSVKFRFRAVLRKQPTYPFISRSKSVQVTVRGA